MNLTSLWFEWDQLLLVSLNLDKVTEIQEFRWNQMRLNMNYTEYTLGLDSVSKVTTMGFLRRDFYEGWTSCSSGRLHKCRRTHDTSWDASLSSFRECLRKLSEAHKQSRSLRGIMWMCVWNMTCPAAAPLLTNKLNESLPVAFTMALLIRGTLEHMAATTCMLWGRSFL